jgi:hypothetical protein
MCCVSGGLKVSVKKTRAPADLEENLDDRNVPAAEPSTLPPGFLSPSVKEYLELGKSIPGNTEAVLSNILHEYEHQAVPIFPVYPKYHSHSIFPVHHNDRRTGNTFNPLKTKGKLFYLKTQFILRSKHFSSRL